MRVDWVVRPLSGYAVAASVTVAATMTFAGTTGAPLTAIAAVTVAGAVAAVARSVNFTAAACS